MSQHTSTQQTWGRRSWISIIGAAAAALAVRPAAAQAQAPSAGGRFQPARHAEDAWFDALPGKHRTIIDSFSVKGGGDALLFANNLFVANGAGYKLTDADVAVVVTLRHSSTAFAFTDAMWAKYSKGFTQGLALTDPKTGQVPTFNLYNATGYGTQLPNYGQTIDAVAKRGVHFAVCQMATRRLAGQVAMVHGSTADAMYTELTANLVPNAHMVAAGVIAVTRAQEYGYTVLSAG
jgi:intracellular sulfur oxidation DsrE/DsrF family protein